MAGRTVLLVDRLLGDTERSGDLRPTPPELTRALHLETLELVSEATQRSHGP